MKSAEFLKFSGGITDKTTPGQPDRYSIADNLLIDSNEKLYSRDGFDIFSSTAYQIVANERVGRLVSFKNDSELLAFQNKKAYAISGGAWTEVTGPASGSAFATNTAASLFVPSEWNGHLFMASNSGDPVIKMYRDSGNTMRLRTAGLPAFGDYTDGEPDLTPADGGLADAITLANSLRTKMTAHFASNNASAGTVETTDDASHITHADLTAQHTALTGSTAASTLATLITLVNLLRTQYSDHIEDAQYQQPVTPSASTTLLRNYHVKPASVADYYTLHDCPNNDAIQPQYCWFHFLNFSVVEPEYTIPSDAAIADILPFLNDLRDKWNWHQYSTLTHFNAWRYQGSEDYTQLGVHAVSETRVEPYTWATITPRYGALIDYIENLKTEFDYHRTGVGMHHQQDSVTAVPSGVDSTPDDIWEAVTLLGWLAHSIALHSGDAIGATYQLTCSATAASNTLATAEAAPATNALRDFWAIPLKGVGSSPWLWSLDFTNMPRETSYRVSANTAATSITCANNFGSNTTNDEYLFTASFYHIGGNGASLTGVQAAGISGQPDAQALSKSMADIDYRFLTSAQLQALADFSESIAGALEDHATNGITVLTAAEITYLGKYSNYDNRPYTKYLPEDRTAGTVLISSASGTTLKVTHMHPSTEPFVGATGTYIFPVSPINGSGLAEGYFSDEVPTAVSVNYRACFRYDYTVGSKSFTDRGAPSTPINVIEFANVADSDSSEKGKFASAFSNLYVYANASNENFAIADTTNFRKEIYRTIASGQLYYRADVNDVVADVANATTTYSDYSLDSYLVNQLGLYTNTGAPDNDLPPVSSCIHQANDIMYYVKDNRLYQSIPGDLDSVPGDYYDEYEEDLVAVSSTRSNVVTFGSKKVYRVSGSFDSLGRGAMTHETIYDRTGAISAQGVVKADNGVFFVGKDGFYFTDGYQCMRCTDLQDTLRGYTDSSDKRNRIQGAYDNFNKRVYWTIQTGSSSYPDRIWVLDLQFGIRPDKTPLTTFSGLSSFRPTALEFYGGILHYGDNEGYVFKQTLDRAIDLKKDTSVAATSWEADTIIWDYKSCNFDYGTASQRKYFTQVAPQFEHRSTNISVQIKSDSDKGRGTSDLPIIRSRKIATATGYGDSKFDWIGDIYTTKNGDIVDERRWFKGDGALRANYRAIEMTNAYCVIANSTEMGTLTVANVAGDVYSATLVSLIATRKWPLYSVDYYLKISGVEYPVTVRTSDSVIRIDATGLTAPTVGTVSEWELWGKPKGERVRLLGYNVTFDLQDQQQADYKGTATTGNENS